MHVLVVDDEPLARRRLCRIVIQLHPAAVLHVAATVAEARTVIEGNNVDIVLLDVEMPGGEGFGLLDEVERGGAVVVFVTAFDEYAVRAFDAGAADYVTKPVDPKRLALALTRAISRRDLEKRAAVSSAAVESPSPLPVLTRRQSDILALIAEGHSNKETARRLRLSHLTVRNHLTLLYRSQGVSSRRALVERFRSTGLVNAGPAPSLD